jgi:hypothetical protein
MNDNLNDSFFLARPEITTHRECLKILASATQE